MEAVSGHPSAEQGLPESALITPKTDQSLNLGEWASRRTDFLPLPTDRVPGRSPEGAIACKCKIISVKLSFLLSLVSRVIQVKDCKSSAKAILSLFTSLAIFIALSSPALGPAGISSALAAPAPSPSAQAEDSRQTQIDREKSVLQTKIAEADKQAKAISKQIGISDARRAALQAENAQLKAKLSAQQQQLAQAESQLGVAQSDLELVKGNIDLLTARVGQMQTRLEVRQRMAYKMGGLGGYLELLISADSFRGFLSRLTFVKKAIGEDRTRLAAVENLARQLDAAKTEISRRSEAIAAQKASIEAQRSSLTSVQKAVSQNQQKVAEEISVHKGLLGQVQTEKAIYLKQVKQLEAESRSISALLKAKQKGQVFQAGGTKKLAWPTTGPLSSSYGHRTHPIFGDRRMHAGIDISAPSGQAVVAAETGTVIWAGAKGGYGNTVIIDHGNALATLYAHLSSVSVSQGAKVNRSFRVGAVGCTGYCTGPHLHFETRVNGEPVNPMQFF